MRFTPAFRRTLRDRGGRSAFAAFGLVVYSLGVYLQLQANIGISPWNALNQGLSMRLPISFGNASIIISLLIIGLDLLLHEPIGLGTVLDALVVGWALDFFLWAGLVPLQTFLPVQLAVLIVGLVIMCVGAYLYMKTGLSCGPRDAMLVALGKRLPRFSIGTINIALLAVVLVASTLLGSPLGLGTLITIFGTGAIMDLVFKVLRFDPRSVEHEGLVQTWAALVAAGKEESQEAGQPR